MNDKQHSLPLWVLIVSGFVTALEIMVSMSMIVTPQMVLETVDLSAKGVTYLVQMWAVRQFALGCIFAYATFRKSTPMLTIAYIFFLVMMIGDLIVGVTQNNTPLIIGASVMAVFASAMLVVLNKKK